MRPAWASLAAACCLAGHPARAAEETASPAATLAHEEFGPEIPGGHLYFGTGLHALVVTGPTRCGGDCSRLGAALSLELAYEARRVLVRAALMLGGARTTLIGGASLDAAALLDGGSTSKYIGLGIASLGQSEGGDYGGNGLALSAEAGFLFSRQNRWGRTSLGLRWTLPTFSKDDKANPPRYPWQPFSFLSLVLHLAL